MKTAVTGTPPLLPPEKERNSRYSSAYNYFSECHPCCAWECTPNITDMVCGKFHVEDSASYSGELSRLSHKPYFLQENPVVGRLFLDVDDRDHSAFLTSELKLKLVRTIREEVVPSMWLVDPKEVKVEILVNNKFPESKAHIYVYPVVCSSTVRKYFYGVLLAKLPELRSYLDTTANGLRIIGAFKPLDNPEHKRWKDLGGGTNKTKEPFRKLRIPDYSKGVYLPPGYTGGLPSKDFDRYSLLAGATKETKLKIVVPFSSSKPFLPVGEAIKEEHRLHVVKTITSFLKSSCTSAGEIGNSRGGEATRIFDIVFLPTGSRVLLKRLTKSQCVNDPSRIHERRPMFGTFFKGVVCVFCSCSPAKKYRLSYGRATLNSTEKKVLIEEDDYVNII